MTKRQLLIGSVLLALAASIMILLLAQNSRVSNVNYATTVMRQNIEATTNAVLTMMPPPNTRQPPTPTLAPEVRATVTARDATGWARQTQSWLDAVQTATAKAKTP